MIRKLFLLLAVLLQVTNCVADDVAYRGSSFHKLDNGVSVVFVDAAKSNSLLVMLCISAGSADELDREGVANLLSHMFAQKLKKNAEADALQYGSESNFYTGHDYSMYYFYGKLENLEGFIKNLGDVFANFAFSSDDLEAGRRKIEQEITSENQRDKFVLRQESRKSIYWNSKYGVDVAGDLNHLKKISENDVQNFKSKNYTNNRVTVIIAGNVRKDETLSMVVKYFGDGKLVSKIDRLQEPSHHGSTTKVVKNSPQVSVPIVEMSWRIPNYRSEEKKALAAEIAVNHLENELRKKLVDEQKIASSISFNYSFWNYDYGDFSITITFSSPQNTEELVAAALAEIKYIVSDDISKEQADEIVKKMKFAANMFNGDIFDAVNWLAAKIGSGSSFDFIKGYPDFIEKYDLKDVNAQAKEIFKNEPCVISILKPLEKKDAI
ncbi:MAG: insulinase family protein [Holosporaceae bacterium]|jgi:zinc protease|nr:insulinase family protein [Holosporaceae bacterium]